MIITTDCGADVDDQWVIAHMARSAQFSVRAIVTTHTGSHPILAAPAAESSARTAREVLVHVFARDGARDGAHDGARDGVHGGGGPVVIPGSSVPLKNRTPLMNAGVERIIAESRKQRLTVVVIGAATDTASALLADSSLADRIEIVAMGFQGPHSGDEFNVSNDPIAWQVILDSRVPLTIGGSIVAKRDLNMTSERAHNLLDATDSGRYLAELLDQWLRNQPDIVRSVMGDSTHWPVWDEITTASMLGMAKSEKSPRPKLRMNLSFDEGAGRGTLRWVTEIDSDRLWSDLAQNLKRPLQ
jgi:inosine-uridine nucleoside N-ribohydrolase